jgi:hypothetical protein
MLVIEGELPDFPGETYSFVIAIVLQVINDQLWHMMLALTYFQRQSILMTRK